MKNVCFEKEFGAYIDLPVRRVSFDIFSIDAVCLIEPQWTIAYIKKI